MIDYIEYMEIPTKLRRFSFSSKMGIASNYSRNTITSDGMNMDVVRKGNPSPWELETFVLFSIASGEWASDSFDKKNLRVFDRIIHGIRQHVPPALEVLIGKRDFEDYFLMVARATQFEIQEDVATKLYRYNYYFSFKNESINMEEEFERKFECSYPDFLSVILGWWYWLSCTQSPVSQNTFERMIAAHPKVIETLSISRQDYASELAVITQNPDDYLFCLRPSYSYPFIRDEDYLYLPLPHLLIRSITSSLMFRLTDKNDPLREKIGKEVLENYLFEILHDSNEFDELIPEKEYYDDRVLQKTTDVMARKGCITVFFDSKSFTPKSQIRVFSKEAIKNDIDRIAKGCKQMYRHVHDEFQNKYDFFSHKLSISTEDRYGLVVLAEEPYFRLDLIFNTAAEMLGLEIGSDEYTWMRNHIGIVETYEIERMCFTRSSIVTRVIERSRSHSQNDAWLGGPTDSTEVVETKFNAFRDESKEMVLKAFQQFFD